MTRLLVALAVLAGAPTLAAQPVHLDARTRGDASAPVTLYEVADFQCPACREFFLRTLPALERDYVETGKLRVVFINLPLVSIHANAAAAHELAMCAAAQDRFWPVHDLLYRNQPAWAQLPDPSSYFGLLADSASLDRAQLGACVESGAMREAVLAEANGAVRSGIRSTPSFVIENNLISGAVPIEALGPVIDSIHAVRTSGSRR